MSDIFSNAAPVSRRTMLFIFVIDTSGSMEGVKIGAANNAVEETIPEIRALENADAQIKIAVLEFSSGARWTYPPTEPSRFVWKDASAGGVTDLGEAYRRLNEKLSKNGYMAEAAGSYAPVIFLMSDGMPTDDHAAALAELKKNRWYRVALKVALAIGSDFDKEPLEQFTGNPETVLTANSAGQLNAMIRLISVTASQLGSSSASMAGAGTAGVQERLAERISAIPDLLGEDDDFDDGEGW